VLNQWQIKVSKAPYAKGSRGRGDYLEGGIIVILTRVVLA
jgi:hypothetical protein